MNRSLFRNTPRDWSWRNRPLLDRLTNIALILVLLAAWGWAGGMDMQDQIETERTAVRALDCREQLNLRVAQTADEAAGRCDQPEGDTK